MSRLPESTDGGTLSALGAFGEDAEMIAGQAELLNFELARAAYCPGQPETEKTMLAAFHRFHRLGYEAYFGGATVMPTLFAAQPVVAGMWMDGYRVAETEALTMRCHCDCSRKYVWGVGYGHCPRRRSSLASAV